MPRGSASRTTAWDPERRDARIRPAGASGGLARIGDQESQHRDARTPCRLRGLEAWRAFEKGLIIETSGADDEVVKVLAALTINGTFQGFRFSPHLRFGASLLGIFFWSQWTLGFLLSWASFGGAPSAIVAYGTFCAMELANLTRSGSDIGKDIRGA